MFIIKEKLCLTLFSTLLIFNACVHATESSLDESKKTVKLSSSTKLDEERPDFDIDSRISSLLVQASETPHLASPDLQKLNKVAYSFNEAERFLLLKVEAILLAEQAEYSPAVKRLEKAFSVSENIPEQQRNTPLFSKTRLLLAEYYARVGEFDKGFNEKDKYLKEYRAYSRHEKAKTVELLNKKHETEQKIKSNELLESKNKLKQFQIKEVENEQKDQQRNLILIICTILLLILIFIKQIRVRKKLTILAQTDSLTGLLNRKSLFERGQLFAEEYADKPYFLSSILLDVDYFKNINDRSGHAIGDKVLNQIVSLSNESLRSRDIFARLGGEEFVAVLPEANLAEAKAIAERIKEKIAEFDFKHLGVDQKITVSVGVASLSQVQPSFDNLVSAADFAMYEAKTLGRNQVVSYTSDSETAKESKN